MSKHLVVVGRKISLETVRNFQQNQAERGADTL